MGKTQRNFVLGRMNKSLDERLLRNGEYVDALNVRLGSTEESEVGSVENAKGNTRLTELYFIDPITLTNTPLSSDARTIGVFEDGANETLYWFVHDPSFSLGDTGKLDMILSLNVLSGQIVYHIISIDDGGGENTTLNFNPQHLITGTDKVSDLLFFTDYLNPPRFINVNNAYGEPVAFTPARFNPTGVTAFVFKAGTTQIGTITQTGFHQGTVIGCPAPTVTVYEIGEGVLPTTTQINLPGTGCYTSASLSNNPVATTPPITPGYGILGVNNASQFALTMFIVSSGSSTSATLGLIMSSGLGTPGSGIINGNITGSDGSVGTYQCSYSTPLLQYVDAAGQGQNPESVGPLSITGLTITEDVTYTLTL
tara:strand:- start:2 stop:1105 length:1104 start_codon:yes stop_codon:yes gene_type:complete